VRSSAISANADRDDMRMLDKQQQIAHVAGAALIHERPLQRERFAVRHQTETTNA
jgi:hypothetical protein